MSDSLGFSYRIRKSGEVEIRHEKRFATTLRGKQATKFRDRIEGLSMAEAQQWMARLTGNYKRGNERNARRHARNRE